MFNSSRIVPRSIGPRTSNVVDHERLEIAGRCGRQISLVRRCKDLLADHLSDIPDPSAAERSIIRRAAVLTVELERLEKQFALAGEADPDTLDLYGRTSGNLRRLLEAVGLQRRARDISPTLADIMREHGHDEA